MRTLPYAWYSDPDVLAAERRRLFAPAWHYAGVLPDPGAYVTARAGDVPIVAVRDAAGELRAFVNVCRHRGAEVVSGAGRCTTLQCHYHAWTYGLDGALRAAPRAGPELARDRLGLLPAAVGTWGPFVFVNADPDAAPLAQTLGPLPDIAREHGLDPAALAFHHRVRYGCDANWKVAVENYLECYHCAVAHPAFSAVVDVRPEAYELRTHPTFASHFAPARDGAGQGQFHLVWPGLKVNVMPGPPNLSIGPVWPVSPGRTEGFLDYFFAPDADPEWIARFLALDDQVGAEDVVLVESVQRGIASGALEAGELMLPAESLIAAFQRWVSDALAREPQLPGA
jgi:choline monooxygenase